MTTAPRLNYADWSGETLFLWAIGRAPKGFDWLSIAPEDRGEWAKWALEWEDERSNR